MWKVVKQQLQALPQNLPRGIEEEETDEEKKPRTPNPPLTPNYHICYMSAETVNVLTDTFADYDASSMY
jgi:hypothetical protein